MEFEKYRNKEKEIDIKTYYYAFDMIMLNNKRLQSSLHTLQMFYV